MAAREQLAQRYRDFALATAGQSACFADWSTAVAGDPAVLDWIGRLPGAKQQPNLVFAAARWHGVAAPGPYAGLRDALLGDDGTIEATIAARSTQTNEVGRLAALVPVFAGLARSGGDRWPCWRSARARGCACTPTAMTTSGPRAVGWSGATVPSCAAS